MAQNKKKERRHYILGVLFSCLFTYLALRDIDFTAFLASLKKANLWYLFPLFLAVVLFFWMKTERWKIMLRPLKPLKTRELYPSMIIGVAINYMVFAYLGELVRTYLFWKQTGIRKSSIIGTIFLERVFDLMSILVLLGIGMLLAKAVPVQILHLGYTFAFFGMISLAFVLLCVYKTETTLQFVRFCLTKFPRHVQNRFVSHVEHGIRGFRSLTQPKLLVGVIATSIGQWIMMGWLNYLPLLAMGIKVPFYAAYIIVACISFAVLLPSTPGQIGLIEFCYVFPLKYFGIPPDKAFAAALFYHVFLYATVTLTGIACLKMYGMTLEQAKEGALESESEQNE